MTRHGLCMIPPLFAYHVVNPRGGAVVVPWYLAGGVSAANCIAAYQPIGAANLAASYTNLANPGTYDVTKVIEPGFDSYGWTYTVGGNNLSCILPSTSVKHSYICRITPRAEGVNARQVEAIGISSVHMYWKYTDNKSYLRGYNATGANAVTPAGDCVMCIVPGESYIDGVSIGSYTAGTGTLTGFEMLKSYGSCAAVAIYDTTLTDDQVAAITTAMNALTSESKAQSLEGLLDFEAEEEKLWWQGADLVEAAAQAIEAPELTWWQKANNVVSDALGKAKKWIDDKLYQLWHAIEDYFDYHEEE